MIKPNTDKGIEQALILRVSHMTKDKRNKTVLICLLQKIIHRTNERYLLDNYNHWHKHITTYITVSTFLSRNMWGLLDNYHLCRLELVGNYNLLVQLNFLSTNRSCIPDNLNILKGIPFSRSFIIFLSPESNKSSGNLQSFLAKIDQILNVYNRSHDHKKPRVVA